MNSNIYPAINMTIAARQSQNSKLGWGFAATYRPVGPTCPSTCPLLRSGECYAMRCPTAWQAKQSEHRTADFYRMRGALFVRWCVSGDWLKPDGQVDHDYMRAAINFAHDNPLAQTYGYTHAHRQLLAAGYGPADNVWPANFKILASTESRLQARSLREMGWQTARVVPNADAPLDEGEVVCPHDLRKHDVTCSSCQLCFPGKPQSIVFVKKTRTKQRVPGVNHPDRKETTDAKSRHKHTDNNRPEKELGQTGRAHAVERVLL